MNSMNIPDNVSEEWKLSKHLIDKVVNKAGGQEDIECHYNYPRDVYFIGNLRPRERDDNGEVDQSLSRRDLMQKLSPSAFGAEFKVSPLGMSMSIVVEISWDCFYRAFPTYRQQKDWSKVIELEEDESLDVSISIQRTLTQEDETPDETLRLSARDRQQERRPREDLFIRFKKVGLNAIGKITCIKEDDEWKVDSTDLQNNISAEFQRAYAIIHDDPERIRLHTAGQLFTLPSQALDSEENFFQFLNRLSVEVLPNWDWEIFSECKQVDGKSDEFILLLQFINSSLFNERDKCIEPFLFGSKIKISFQEDIVNPFELELAPKNFRYNRNLWGRGFNCGIRKITKQNYESTHTPIYTQFRYKTREDPEAKFIDLATNPIPVLIKILEEMRAYLKYWDLQERSYEKEYGELWITYKSEYLDDKAKYQSEIDRFEKGLKLIESDSDILLAFKLANQTFHLSGLGKDGLPVKEKWRLFQIVFMVSQIPGIAALTPKYKHYLKEREYVDIVYFPTGGGKTEAYLAVLAFHCFYDRLREKTAGVTCWIRFPLRLLTIQQTQRLADIIGTAELIRREQKDPRLKGKGIYPFSVGYYVGRSSTPNIIPDKNNQSELSKALDPIERQTWKRVVTCPSCKTNSITVEFDEEKHKVLHRCSNNDCKFIKGELPVYIVDNEIYRYLPTVIVGTIDKLASIGQQRKLSLVFGKVDGYCRVHGFYNSRCCQDNCTDSSKLEQKPPKGISGPTLFLQDELHLLREGLGTFDSHYETFSQYLLREAGEEAPLKIIASSATIEKYERQVEHLYGRNPELARVFPGIGPTLRSSFYAITEDYPQRIYVGILPHNKTIFNSVLEIIEYYHKTIQLLAKLNGNENPFGGNVIPGSQDWFKLLDLYYTSLTYFLATRELDSMKTDIESHVNHVKLENEGLRPVDIKQLTGGTTTDEVTQVLEQLEKYHYPTDLNEAVLATNMISHGVDINRFNSMVFYGIPRQNAEYIQASSRVGRSHIGIVFNCFHPIRERDRSHYAYFEKYHEFLGQMVEPVAINRWSTYGIDKTLPGLFMGTILQIIANRDNGSNRQSYYMLSKITEMYTSGEIDKEEIKNILKDAYRAGITNDQRNNLFDTRINEAVEQYFDNITHPGITEKFLSKALYPRPMSSLRDIDESIDIVLDYKGSQWGNID